MLSKLAVASIRYRKPVLVLLVVLFGAGALGRARLRSPGCRSTPCRMFRACRSISSRRRPAFRRRRSSARFRAAKPRAEFRITSDRDSRCPALVAHRADTPRGAGPALRGLTGWISALRPDKVASPAHGISHGNLVGTPRRRSRRLGCRRERSTRRRLRRFPGGAAQRANDSAIEPLQQVESPQTGPERSVNL
jgi:hypothetical protein